MSAFKASDFLIPSTLMEHWAVIACDQFTSEPEYWEQVRETVGEDASALNMIFPEVYLENGNGEKRIAHIHAAMQQTLQEHLFDEHKNCYIYVERTLLDGSIRPGIVGVIDLEQYDFHANASSAIRATERTVESRIPPRMRVRKDAPLELSHVLLLCNDYTRTVIEPLREKKAELQKLYDFMLMQDGGHIAGWLVSGATADELTRSLEAYEARMRESQQGDPEKALLYAVGDGNHSLATAKSCYDAMTASDKSTSKARCAMVELENVYDDSLVFEPIHRVITETDTENMITELKARIGKAGGYPLHYLVGQEEHTVEIELNGCLPVAVLQDFLDAYLLSHPGKIDYIHDRSSVEALCDGENRIGFLLPAMNKEDLFPGIVAGGVLPRKTFSMGHAREKRYYLEARAIK